MPFRKGWWLLLTAAFLPWIRGRAQINRDNELCEDGLNAMDLYVLYPTSAFVNTTRLGEIKRLTRSAFQPKDFGNRGLRVHTMLYKKAPRTVLQSGLTLEQSDFNDHFRKVKVMAIANTMRKIKPTYAHDGLKYFQDNVVKEAFSGTPNEDGTFDKPVMLLFYVIEDLHPTDLRQMVDQLVNITRSGNVFVLIVIGNPNGTSFKTTPEIAVPHEDWNALAIDDSGDLQKYTTLLRKSMCRFSQRRICLVTAEAGGHSMSASDPLKKALLNPFLAKSFTADELPETQEAAGNVAVHITKKLNSCCNEYVFSPPADDGLQKCCDTTKDATTKSVVMIDDYEEDMDENGNIKDVCQVAMEFRR